MRDMLVCFVIGLRVDRTVFYPCPTCGASEQDGLFSCAYCEGQRLIEEEESVRVQIPPMVSDYTQVEV